MILVRYDGLAGAISVRLQGLRYLVLIIMIVSFFVVLIVCGFFFLEIVRLNLKVPSAVGTR